MPLLETEEIHTYYGDSHILRGVSLSVESDSVIAVLGRNGAGKTTLARSIVGFTPPRRGTVRFAGRAIEHLPAHEIARSGITIVPQGRRIFRSLSVTENLTIGLRKGEWTLGRVFDLFPQLKERRRNRGDQLSGGEQSMVSIGRALMANPKLLVMDEPSEGLAPLAIAQVGEALAHVKEQGMSIMVIEQNIALALGLAEQVYVLNRGEVVYHDTPARLEADEEVKQRYLGLGA